jgi:hypothetical protein
MKAQIYLPVIKKFHPILGEGFLGAEELLGMSE